MAILGLSTEELLAYSYVLNALLGFILVMIYMFAFEPTLIWLQAWWQKRPVILEWGKGRRWQFKIPKIDPSTPESWETDNGKRVYYVRDEAVGIAPHKVRMMLVSSEFPSGLSPTEIEGQRYYATSDYFMGYTSDKGDVVAVEEITNADITRYDLLATKELTDPDEMGEYASLGMKIKHWNARQMFVKYPTHGINVAEFVNHQRTSTSPEMIAAYARQKVLEIKNMMHSPVNFLFQNMHVLIPLVLIIAIAFGMIQDYNIGGEWHSQALACEQKMTDILAGKLVNSDIAVVNKTILKGTGGFIK